MAINSGVETITPDTATKWLSMSKVNRHIYNNVVIRYVRAIQSDSWMVNGEAIVFDNAKTLVNGHHRLHACIKAGRPFQSLVVRGVEPKSFDTFDSGRSRSATDVFGLQGYDNPRTLSATLALLWRYRNDMMGRNQGMTPAVQELEEILRMYPEAVSSVEYCSKVRLVASHAIMSFIHCLGSRADTYKADQFIDSMYDGAELKQDSPVRLLRERWLQQKGRAAGKMQSVTALAVSIKAWNYFYVGEPLSVLKWASGEEFPTFGQVTPKVIQKRQRARNANHA